MKSASGLTPQDRFHLLLQVGTTSSLNHGLALSQIIELAPFPEQGFNQQQKMGCDVQSIAQRQCVDANGRS
jgi:hypothetical protein